LGAPAIRDRPNIGSNELFDNVTASKYSAGEVKSAFAISDPHCSMVEFSSIHSKQGFDRAEQRTSWPFVAWNLRHVDLHIEPARVPIISQVGLAARSDLNSRNPFSGVLSSGVESAACMLSFVILPVVDFDDIGNNDQLKNLAKASTLRLRPKVFMIQINFDTSRKDVGES
jgi:hypothetical protein